MLIVTKDKRLAVNLNNVEAFNIQLSESGEYYELNANTPTPAGSYYRLGIFDHKEDAESQLNRILSAYNNGEKVFFMP